MTFAELRAANVKRTERVWHPLEDWTPSEWACALAGEVGEACNAVKKLRRLAGAGNSAEDAQAETEAVMAIAEELADSIIYCDLLGARLGIDLEAAVRAKFNQVSERRGADIFL